MVTMWQRGFIVTYGAIKLALNASNYPPFASRCKSINQYERWYKGAQDMWRQYRIDEYTDGSATRRAIGVPITEKEYFKRNLAGTL